MSEAIRIKTLISEEWELIQLSKKNPQHFKELYKRYYKQIFVFILKRTNDKSASADICSEVFLTALTKLDQYQNRGFPFSSWLYKIAVNACTDHFKDEAKKRYLVLDGTMKNDLMDEVAEKGTDVESIRATIIPALDELSPKELELIELRYFEKISFREIAFYFDITENNAKVRTYRILHKLKSIITSNSNEE